MISIKKMGSKAISISLQYIMNAYEFKNDFLDVLKELGTNIKVSSPVSLLSILSGKKEVKKAVKEDIYKVFEPNTHIFKRKLLFPENMDIYNEMLNNIPTGYGVLEPVDGCGYSIEDINSYVGEITLIFYNCGYVNAVGIYDEDSDTYVFNNPGNAMTSEFNQSYIIL